MIALRLSMKKRLISMGEKKTAYIFNGLFGAGIFLFIRLLLFIFLPYEVFTGYGDLINFFRVAQIPGWPYINYWVEFPPFFPFVSEMIFRLSGGSEVLYVYCLAGLFSIFDAGSILVAWELLKIGDPADTRQKKLFLYVLILSFFPYAWWYFEPMLVFFFLLGIFYIQREKPLHAGAAIAAGVLLKVFPILIFIQAWLTRRNKSFFISIGVFAVLTAAVLGLLWGMSPEFTSASLASQYAKGSWETVWALLDGNLGTGNFGALRERLDPQFAYILRGKPALIPPLIPLVVAGLIGLVILLKSQNRSSHGQMAMIGLAWCLLILASPGWSPQWVLLIIPLCLLVFPLRRGLILTGLLVLVNFAEWPIIISRGRSDLLWMTILLRTAIIIILVVLFAKIGLQNSDESRGET